MLHLSYEFASSQSAWEPGGKAAPGLGQLAGGRGRKGLSHGAADHPLLRAVEWRVDAGAHLERRPGAAAAGDGDRGTLRPAGGGHAVSGVLPQPRGGLRPGARGAAAVAHGVSENQSGGLRRAAGLLRGGVAGAAGFERAGGPDHPCHQRVSFPRIEVHGRRAAISRRPDNSYFNRVLDRRAGQPDQSVPGLFVAGAPVAPAGGGHRPAGSFFVPLSNPAGRRFTWTPSTAGGCWSRPTVSSWSCNCSSGSTTVFWRH